MAAQVDLENVRTKSSKVYKKLSPDGGYGYIIVASMTLLFLTTFVPFACFGLLYGPYLAELGDETTSVTTVASLFSCIFHFTGIISNPLLQKYPKRAIGIIGALLICLGSLGSIFITTVPHLVISYGIIQGLGVGFILPATMTTYNDYFTSKKNLMMGISQTVIVAMTILFPTFVKFLLNQYGFRGTVAIIAALNAHAILAAISLHPVKWHLKTIIEEEPAIENIPNNESEVDNKHNGNNSGEDGHLLKKRQSLSISEGEKAVRAARPSVISIDSFVIPTDVGTTKNEGFWKSLDFSVLKDPFYYNLIVGVAMGLVAENIFIAILPGYLAKHAYTKEDVAVVMTAYFAADLGGRLFFTTCMALVSISNRMVFLGASVMCILVRVAFSSSQNFWWIITATGGLGVLRGFIHTPIVLAIAEEYSEKFTSAFTLYMVLSGIVVFMISQIMNAAKYLTQSDEVVMYILTILYVLVVVFWSIELIYKRAKGIKPRPRPTNISVAH